MSQPDSSQAAFCHLQQSYSGGSLPGAMQPPPDHGQHCLQLPQPKGSATAFSQEYMSQQVYSSSSVLADTQQAPMCLQTLPSSRPYGHQPGLRKPSVSPWHFTSQVHIKWHCCCLNAYCLAAQRNFRAFIL